MGKNPTMLFLRFVILFIILLNFYNVSAQKKTSVENLRRPKLVVGIVVDQMRSDYIERYWDKLGNGGFKKLMNDGFNCKNAKYNYVPTYTGPGHASIYTGTTPCLHGIIANDWYNRLNDSSVYCVQDDDVQTIGAPGKAGKMSPKNLLVTTITDELRLATNFKAKVFGVSMKDRGSILPSGHSANAAYWFDAGTGNFITSSFYMNDLPEWAKNWNNKKIANEYLSKPWNTLYPIAQYTASTVDDTPYEQPYSKETRPVFPYDLPKLRKENFELLRRTPFGNTVTKEFAGEIIKNEKMGEDDITDFLTISFSCTDYVGHQFGTNSIETEDTYLRLDKDLEEFINQLDADIGKGNYLIFLTADHAAIQNPKYLSDHKIPAGLFDIKKVKEELNLFMTNTYGEGKWISDLDNDQVYFNKSLMVSKTLDLDKVADKVASFLMDFKGVSNTITVKTLEENEFRNGIKNLVQNGFNHKRSGDVIIILEPGLIEYGITGSTHGSAYSYDTHIPLLWYGWNIKSGSSVEQVFITDIAPTLSMLLNIEFPNGCTGKPIEFLFKP